MSTTVDTSFIQLYASEVKAAYQREGALLRQAVRVREGVAAERVYFPTLGKGIATTKARHADVNPMNTEHDRVYVDMADFYAPEYIDELDQAKVNFSLRAEYVRASAMALGRKTDDLIITAVDAACDAASHSQVAASLDLASVAAVSEEFNERDVPLDNMRFAVISPAYLSDLLGLAQATSNDYTREQIIVSGRKPAFWMGFNWIMHTGLPANVGALFFHRISVGLGVCRDIQTTIDWVPTKVAWLVNSWMSMGAVVIDPEGVHKLELSGS